MAATPTIVLVPVWGIGHFVPMLEVGKRLLARSALPLTVTVLVMPLPAEAKRASEITEHIRQQEASGLAICFHHLPAVEPQPTTRALRSTYPATCSCTRPTSRRSSPA